MTIADWLDTKEEEIGDVSNITVPDQMLYDEDPEETLFFKEIRPCGFFCTKNHPFATVERYGHWYRSRGRDKQSGVHTNLDEWSMYTRDKELALKTAKKHIQ